MSGHADTSPLLDRYTTMGELTGRIAGMTRKAVPILAVVLTAVTVYLFVNDSPGAIGFALIAAGSIVALIVWVNGAMGLPLLPMMAVQSLLVYGLPIASGHQVVLRYPPEYVTQSGFEILAFSLALIGAWKLAMQVFSPSPPLAYALVGVDREGVAGLGRLGFGLAGAATAFLILESLNLAGFIFSLLPSGSYPIIRTGAAVASACGFFLLSLLLSSGEMPFSARLLFWLIVSTNCVISASGFLLSAASGVLVSVVIGLFWGSGRVPWKHVVVIMLVVSFFNTGKYAMRDRYWESPDEESARPSGLLSLPVIYLEWTEASWDSLTGGESDRVKVNQFERTRTKGQSLLERLNNLQNMLYVIDAMGTGNIPALGGKTYAVIPPLLIPRILWPSKPRTHEGQVLLNVHFGRQDLQSTFKTYVAWGLPAEAYGNFGALKGVVVVGVILGIIFAWAENYTARKPILSTEGFVSFVIFLGLANSFEMVASVLITSIFQSIVPVVIACAPFVRRKVVERPEAE